MRYPERRERLPRGGARGRRSRQRRPGLRWYHYDYYGAHVLDPDGNNIEAACHAPG